ncbi:MAG: hypothetical protein GC200_02225 [Tepidisphaera sp.]|nr:hypothetical protein [Tepidisphaera sp.]
MNQTPDNPPRSVLLRHTLPDGTGHFDWFLEDRPAQVLRSFRLAIDPLASDALAFEASPASDHRLAYLDFEGEVSGGRGHVSRVWRADMRSCFLGKHFVRVLLHAPDGLVRLHGRSLRSGLWVFRRPQRPQIHIA